MYLKPNQCAICGKALDDSTRFATHNAHLDDAASKYTHRPYFCSQSCIDRHVASVRTDETEHKKLVNEIEREHTNQVVELRESEKTKLHLFQTSSPRPTSEKIEWRRKELQSEFSHWHDLYGQIRDRKLSEARIDHQLNQKKHTQSIIDHLFEEYQSSHQRLDAARPQPPSITDQHRFEHTHILGPQGSGKTTLIQDLILQDLKRPDRPAIIVIDPKGFLVERIAKLKHVNPNDLVIIDPRSDPPPPLNLFNVRGGPKVANQTIASFDYIFAQSGAAISALARPAFRFCARLMFSLPDPSIWKLMDLFESKPNDPQFQPHMNKLSDEGAKRFFQKDFYTTRYQSSADLIKARFQDILSMPEVMTMFSSPSPPIDFVECLQQRKIVLVNTALELGEDVSRLIGRYIISLTLAAAFARGRGGPPAFLYIDEFQDFVDEDATPRQLRLAREYNLGIIMAHQQMFCNEFNDNTRSSVSSATIKYCSKVFSYDRSYMLKDLNCSEHFLDQQVPDHDRHVVKFACSVKGHPTSSIEVPYPIITPDMLRSSAPPEASELTPAAIQHLPDLDAPQRKRRVFFFSALADTVGGIMDAAKGANHQVSSPRASPEVDEPSPATHEPPQSEGSSAFHVAPAEADTPIITQKKIPPAKVDDDTW